ncbi:MAG: hypothetical protein AAFY71_11120 [Bacteroidota bacterium]
MVKKWTLTIILASFFCLNMQQGQARQIFEGLDFNQGIWAMIGVPIHNYVAKPIQEELGTFITKDLGFMKSLKQDWDFPITFDDDCDHHYALKVYKNGQLVRTIEMNLHCGYITIDNLSYTFNPKEFNRFKRHSKAIPWSRITFKDMNTLQNAIRVLEKNDDIFWYEDVSQYKYSGFFMLNINNLAWNTNTDSLMAKIRSKVEEKTRRTDFYVREYFRYTEGETMDIRYLINCDSEMARRLVKYQYLPWRAHLPNKNSEIHILALGIGEDEYRRLMRNR